jgi:hypothetical protein
MIFRKTSGFGIAFLFKFKPESVHNVLTAEVIMKGKSIWIWYNSDSYFELNFENIYSDFKL